MDVFDEDLFGEDEDLTQPSVDDAVVPEDDEDEQYISEEEEEEEGVVPSNKEKPMTNLEFLSRMLHSSLRGYLREYRRWLSHKFSDKLLGTFLDVASKMEDGDVSPDVLGAILPDLGVDDLRRDIIVRSYKLVYEDESKCLLKVTYEKFREIVYREYFDSVKNNNAVETIEKIQNSEFFLPPYGAIQNDTFQQLKFGEFDINNVTEELGSPLYSHFPDINNTSPIKGYIPSQVTMISGPPGCFVGGTKLKQPDGSLKTIYQLYEERRPSTVKHLDSTGKVDWTWKNEGAQKIGSGTDFTKVSVSTYEVPIVCTRNHLFLTMEIGPDLNPDIQEPRVSARLKWAEAQNLQEGDILVSHPMKEYVRVTKVENVSYRKPIAYYDVVENKDHNYFINAGREDICVHNSGKTLVMVNEAVEALRQGKRVLYAAIGDLKPFDFISRICSIVMKMPMSKTALSIKGVYESACKLFPYLKENLTVQFISPDKYTPGQWYKMQESLGNIRENDVFFIDYDTNFASERDSMYAKGDEVYTMAYTLSQQPGKYVFIGSQPKIGNWKDQELGLETASESSRKQQIVDVMITLSHDRDVKNPNNHMGTINIPKNRRGGTTKFKYFMDPTGIMVPITDEAYMTIRDEMVPVSVVKTEFYDLSTHLIPNAIKGEDGET